MVAGLEHICEAWDFEITQAVRAQEINSVILVDVSISTASSMCGWIMPPKLSKLLLIHETAGPGNKVPEWSSLWQYPSVCKASQCQRTMTCSPSILLIDAIVNPNNVSLISAWRETSIARSPSAMRLQRGQYQRITELWESCRQSQWAMISKSAAPAAFCSTHTHTHGQQMQRWVNTQRHTRTNRTHPQFNLIKCDG